jgi:methylated-DNA-protein-cysteine methyltransferase-like protein
VSGGHELELYVKRGCHLCDQMAAELEPWRDRLRFRVSLVEIDDDPILRARFGHKVPVLTEGSFEICHFFLDEAALRAHFEDAPSVADAEPEPGRLYERIYAVVKQIPRGRVATYGQIAQIVGTGARQVGYAMAALKRPDVPWQRVINGAGKVSRRAGGVEDPRQKELLVVEGVLFDRRGRVDFTRVGWDGPDLDWLESNRFFPAAKPYRRG